MVAWLLLLNIRLSKISRTIRLKAFMLGTGITIASAGFAAHAQNTNNAPFAWEPQYITTCQLNGKNYPCRVIRDGQEFYANVHTWSNQLFHFSLVSKSKTCNKITEKTDCGIIKMIQPNNGREAINFAYKKTAYGWSLNEINHALGAPNEHHKLSIPIPKTQEPNCTYNNKQEPCIILPIEEGSQASAQFQRGYAFEIVYIKNYRGKDSYDTVIYEAINASKSCDLVKPCQGGDMLIHENNSGYTHVTKATYWSNNKQYQIHSTLGDRLIINFP